MKTSTVLTTVVAVAAGQCATGFTAGPVRQITSFMTPSQSVFSSTPTPSSSLIQRNMFAGSGADPEEDPEKEAQIEQASKAMGFSVKEYKLVLKMQDGLAKAVNELRVTGGSEGKGVQVTMDGNSPANHIEFKVTDDGKNLGKAALQKELVAAFKEATDAAKKGQQACIQKMNAEIAEELKEMEGLN